MKRFLLLMLTSIFSISHAQTQSWQRAIASDDCIMYSVPVAPPYCIQNHQKNYMQMSGFPVAQTANATFKNMRAVLVCDINGDGADDIIFGANNILFAYSYQGLIWQKTLTGIVIYPPSAGDIDGDGQLEIVIATGGIPDNGRVYALDTAGNTLTGWPVNFSNHWMICAPALSDLDGNGSMEIIVCERISPNGNIHILKSDGSSFNANWPISLSGIPAVTPSAGDIDGDGEKDILVNSTTTRYAFDLNGQAKTGFPLNTEPGQKYSYQSPVLADIDNDGKSEIVGASHGNLPYFYAANHDNSYCSGWPKVVPDSSWTYSTPTVVRINTLPAIFMSRPIGSTADEMLYGWDAGGNMLTGFPINKPGGLEGIICVADIDNDTDYELIFGSNLLDSSGYGFIHAWETNGAGEVPGFPIRPRGWTFMNGACIGDINGDGLMDLAVLSYTNTFGAGTDSVYMNVYEMNVPMGSDKILWGTYKGSNTRSGYTDEFSPGVKESACSAFSISVFPNPADDFCHITFENDIKESLVLTVTDIRGMEMYRQQYNGIEKGRSIRLNIGKFSTGIYVIRLDLHFGLSRIAKLIRL